jgi:chorismate dehydratase
VVRVGVVSYLNSLPLVHGLRHSLAGEAELVLDYPSRLPSLLSSGAVEIAMLPVAAMPHIAGARLAADYGIAADGPVASVALFSQVPMDEIEEVMLDNESCTSVALAQLLLRDFWRKDVKLRPAQPGYIEQISGRTAGVIIGDRALQHGNRFAYRWDLAAAWKEWTGLPFIFAAWVSVRDLPPGFIQRFNAANEDGMLHIPQVVAAHAQAPYDVAAYFRDNLRFRLTPQMREGMAMFLQRLATLPAVGQAAA